MPKKKEELIEEEKPRESLWLSKKRVVDENPIPTASRLPKFFTVLLGFTVIGLLVWGFYHYGFEPITARFVTPTPTPTQAPIPTVTPMRAEANQYYAWCMEKAFGMPYESSLEDQEITEDVQRFVDYCKSNFENEETIVCKPSDTIMHTDLGQIVTVKATDGSEEEHLFDPSAVLLADNRIRIYYSSSVNGVVSAISQTVVDASSKEVPFEVQVTSIVPRYIRPEVILLSDDSYRLFAINEIDDGDDMGIYSFLSTDALSFENEGVRITAESLALENIVDFDVVSVGDGYRMYVEGETGEESKMIVVTSVDSINWEQSSEVVDGVFDSPTFNTDNLGNYHVISKYETNYCLGTAENGLNFTNNILIGNGYVYPGFVSSVYDFTQIGDNTYLLLSFGITQGGDADISAEILQFTQ